MAGQNYSRSNSTDDSGTDVTLASDEVAEPSFKVVDLLRP